MKMQFGILMALALTGACVPADKQKKEDGEASEALSTKPADKAEPTPAETPSDGETPAAPPLSSYVGKYPWDKVDGVDFLHHPLVIKAVENAYDDIKVRSLVLGGQGRTGPIIETRGRLWMRYDDPRGAGSYNWGLLVSEDGRKSAICLAEGDPVPDVSGTKWYSDMDEAFVLYEPCPGEAEEVEQMTSDWPIGPMPN